MPLQAMDASSENISINTSNVVYDQSIVSQWYNYLVCIQIKCWSIFGLTRLVGYHYEADSTKSGCIPIYHLVAYLEAQIFYEEKEDSLP